MLFLSYSNVIIADWIKLVCSARMKPNSFVTWFNVRYKFRSSPLLRFHCSPCRYHVKTEIYFLRPCRRTKSELGFPLKETFIFLKNQSWRHRNASIHLLTHRQTWLETHTINIIGQQERKLMKKVQNQHPLVMALKISFLLHFTVCENKIHFKAISFIAKAKYFLIFIALSTNDLTVITWFSLAQPRI